MYLNSIIVFVLTFLLSFFLCILLLKKKNFTRQNFHLIIPSICLILTAFVSLIMRDFNPIYRDFIVFYDCGKFVLTNPTKLYDYARGVRGGGEYYYTPLFAVIFAISLSLLPLSIASLIFYFFNIFLGLLSIFEFNKIIMLMNVKEQRNRLIFLLLISNGYALFLQFYCNQSKLIIFVIILYILRRELQFNKEMFEKDLKFYLINYSLIVFAVGLAPYFIFLLLIYIFHDIKANEILNRINIRKYLLLVLIFFLENFLFILYPSMFIKFILKGITYKGVLEGEDYEFSYRYGYFFTDYMDIFLKLSLFIYIFFSLFLIIKKNLRLTEKYGYFGLLNIFIGIYSSPMLLYHIALSLFLLIFIPHLIEEDKKNFIKNNLFLLLGLIGILIFSLTFPHSFYEARVFHLYPYNYFYKYVIIYRFFYLMTFILLSLVMSKYKLLYRKRI